MPVLDPSGLTIDTLIEIKQRIEQDQRDTIDPEIVTAETEPLGQVNGIFANELRRLQELIKLLYLFFDPWAAEGVALDNLLSLSGTVRRKAKASTVVCLVNLDATTTLVAGSEAHVAGDPTNLWSLDSDVTSTTAGDYESNWTSKVLGPTLANAGTLTAIATPSTGWNSITNPLDAIPGNNEESDTSARRSREDQLQKAGGATPGGIKSEISAVAGVISVQDYENTALIPDQNGLPGKSFEMVVWDGVSQDAVDDQIAQAIWESRAAGIESYGNTSGTAVDSEGIAHTMYFSRAVQTDTWLEFDLVTDEDYGGDDLFKQAIVLAASTEQLPGNDVIKAYYIGVAISQPGVNNVTDVRLGFDPSPVLSGDLSIGIRERAVFDTSRIEVLVS